MHAHQCGLTAADDLREQGYGCGHIWHHEDMLQYDIQAHYCPKCGKGPFTFKVLTDGTTDDIVRPAS